MLWEPGQAGLPKGPGGPNWLITGGTEIEA